MSQQLAAHMRVIEDYNFGPSRGPAHHQIHPGPFYATRKKRDAAFVFTPDARPIRNSAVLSSKSSWDEAGAKYPLRLLQSGDQTSEPERRSCLSRFYR
jgi:hypothetical protein